MSQGLITGVAEGGTSIVVKDPVSGATVPFAVTVTNGAVPTFTGGLVRITADDYADDAALRADMYTDPASSNLTYDTPALAATGSVNSGGQAGKGARIFSCINADLITLDTSTKIQGVSCFKQRFPGGTTATTLPNTYFGKCAGSVPVNPVEGWLFQSFLMDGNSRPFMAADPAQYTTGGIGYKHLSVAADAGGRWEMEWENVTDTNAEMGETSSLLNGSYDTESGLWYNYAFPSNSPVWSSPVPYGVWLRIKQIASTDVGYPTPYQLRVSCWTGPLSAVASVVKVYDLIWTLDTAHRVESGGTGLPAFQTIHPFGDNCNQRRYAGDRYMWRGATIFADPNTDIDPWGILTSGTPVIGSISPTLMARGATGDVAVTGSKMDQLMDGAAFSNAGVTVNSVTPVDRSHCTVNITVASGATTGAGTMLVKHRFENDSNTVAFSVT